MEANGQAAHDNPNADRIEHEAHDGAAHEQAHEHEGAESQTNETVTVAATVGVVAVGAALFEVALLPGMALGVAAMLAPKYVPKMGDAVAPMFRRSVRGVYKFSQKTREMVAEAKEQVNDIVAEVQAEADKPSKAGTAAAAEAAARTEAPRA